MSLFVGFWVNPSKRGGMDGGEGKSRGAALPCSKKIEKESNIEPEENLDTNVENDFDSDLELDLGEEYNDELEAYGPAVMPIIGLTGIITAT